MKASELLAKLEDGFVLIRYPLDYEAMSDYEIANDKPSEPILNTAYPLHFWLVPAKEKNGRKIQEWYEVVGYGSYGWKSDQCFASICDKPFQWACEDKRAQDYGYTVSS